MREHISYASGMKQARENALEGNEYGDGFEPFQSGQAAALTKLRHSLFCVCMCVRADVCVSVLCVYVCACVYVCVHVFMCACACLCVRASGLLVEGANIAALPELNVCDACMTYVFETGSFLGTIPPFIGCNVCTIYVCHVA